MPTFPQPPHSSQISHHRAISVDTSPEPLQVGQVLAFTAIIIAPGGPSISPTPLQFGQFANFLLLSFILVPSGCRSMFNPGQGLTPITLRATHGTGTLSKIPEPPAKTKAILT